MQRFALILLSLVIFAAISGCKRTEYSYGAKEEPEERPQYKVSASRNSP